MLLRAWMILTALVVPALAVSAPSVRRLPSSDDFQSFVMKSGEDKLIIEKGKPATARRP
jgi:hypothetical protein